MPVKASSEVADGVFSLLEAKEPPGFGPPLHIHHDAAEADEGLLADVARRQSMGVVGPVPESYI